MTRKFIVGLILFLFACPLFAQNIQPGQPNQPRTNRARGQAIGDVVQGLFITQFQEQVQVSDDQFVKVLPLLRNNIQTMRQNANRSLRATNRLRQMLQQGTASEEELDAQIREADEADRIAKNSQQAFLKVIDPFLTTEQKARFRVFQSTFDQRLRELVVRARQFNRPANPESPQ